jgi:hypothetical protein
MTLIHFYLNLRYKPRTDRMYPITWPASR